MGLYEYILVAICCWREARGESLDAKIAQIWSVKNRVLKPGWWGKDWVTVILQPFQYSSFNMQDVNATKWPSTSDHSWIDCLTAVNRVQNGAPDPTDGATHYHDTSISPPSWAAEMKQTAQIGRLIFYKAG